MNVLILGANSDIAAALAGIYAEKEGASLTLASRNMEALERQAEDLRIRHQVSVDTAFFDAGDHDSHGAFYESLPARPDVVVAAFGHLGDQKHAETDFNAFKKIVDVNFLGAASILEIIAADFERVRRGTLIGIGSVAGERGRASNYAYGAAKGAFDIYLSGLRHRLHGANVKVLTVLPGFVATKMTDGMPLPVPLTAKPEQVAADIHRAVKKGKNRLYTLWFWRFIMMIVKYLPEPIFLKTKL